MEKPDVLIVGAGPAGGRAALALAEAGIGSVLLDDNAQAGGQVWRTGSADEGNPYPFRDDRGDALRRALAAHGDRIDYRPEHELVGFFPGKRLWVSVGGGERIDEFQPRYLIVATGALEVFAPVPGWTLPGVLGLGGLQALLKTARLVPEGPVVLGGAGPLLHLVAAQLSALGADVVAVADAAGRPSLGQVVRMATRFDQFSKGFAFDRAFRRLDVPLMRRHAVVEVIGEDSVEAVRIAPVDRSWRPMMGAARTIQASFVGLGLGVRPNVEITRLADCAHSYDPWRGGWSVRRDLDLETSVEGLFVAGAGGGIGGVEAAIHEGVVAAGAVAKHLGATDALRTKVAQARRSIRSLDRFRDGLADWSRIRPGIFEIATGETMICRCEDVRRSQLDGALAGGYDLLGPLKMNTRAGMGLCQGRTCTPAVQHMVARSQGLDLAAVELPTNRTPLRPVPAAAIAAMTPPQPAEAAR